MSIRFTQPTSLLVGDDLNSVISGDVNGDGAIDLIVSRDTQTNRVSILLNDGTETFAAPIDASLELGAAATVSAIVAADMNQDGRLDLVVLSRFNTPGNPAGISVLLGDGAGGFGAAKTANIPVDASGSLLVADLNGDRFPDVAISQPVNQPAAAPTLSLLFGDGTDGLKQPQACRFGSPVVAGDFNRDGRLDLAAKGETLLNKGQGQFRKVTDAAPDSPSRIPSNLITGDFNSDRKLDLARVGTLWLGDGLGRFPKASSFPFINEDNVYSRENTTSIIAGDFNRDGRLDLIETNNSAFRSDDNYLIYQNRQSLLLGNGRAKFIAPAPIWETRGRGETPLVADFNGDGRLDVVVLSKQDNPFAPRPAQGFEDTLKIKFNLSEGKDFIFFDDALVDASRESQAMRVDLQSGQLELGKLRSDVTGYDDVIGTPFGDRIEGNGNSNEIEGYRGDDRIGGRGGNDYLLGADGEDRILGMDGDDFLVGAQGNDRLTGGKGQDFFIFEPIENTARSFKSLGVDRILDFTTQIDKISIPGWGSRGLGFARTEAQAERQFSKLVYTRSTGILYYNPNGRLPGFGWGGAFADLGDRTLLTAADIS